MAKTRQQKEQMLKDINQKIKESNSVIFCVFDKLLVNEDQKIRAELRQNNVSYQVVKKTLLKKSFLKDIIQTLPENELRGNISMATSLDEIMSAKILSKFSQEKEDFKILGGILNKIWIDINKISELAKMPSRQELLAKTVRTIQAPLTGFVNVLTGNVRGLMNVLSAIKDKTKFIINICENLS